MPQNLSCMDCAFSYFAYRKNSSALGKGSFGKAATAPYDIAFFLFSFSGLLLRNLEHTTTGISFSDSDAFNFLSTRKPELLSCVSRKSSMMRLGLNDLIAASILSSKNGEV